MSIAKLLYKKFPNIYEMIWDIKLRVQAGKLRPTRVKIQNGQIIHVDYKEPRGRAILKNQGKGQHRIKNIWSKLLKDHEPNLILDCGANYGEIVFSNSYAKDQNVIAIEADPTLYKWLLKSHKIHPNKDQITIVNALLGESNKGAQTFYIDNTWSGRSTAVKDHGFKDFTAIEVSNDSVDHLAVQSKVVIKDMVLFKIDVEGFEPQVVRGMHQLVKDFNNCIGIIEFNLDFLRDKFTLTEEYLSFLNKNFEGGLILDNDIHYLEHLSLDEIQSLGLKFNDIIVFSKHLRNKIKETIK